MKKIIIAIIFIMFLLIGCADEKNGEPVIAEKIANFSKIFGLESVEDVVRCVMVYGNGKSVELTSEDAESILYLCWDYSESRMVRRIKTADYIDSIYSGPDAGYINFYTADGDKYTLYTYNVEDEYGQNCELKQPHYWLSPLIYGKLEDGSFVTYEHRNSYITANVVRWLYLSNIYVNSAVESDETPAELKILDCVLPETESIAEMPLIAEKYTDFYKIFGIELINDVVRCVTVYRNGKSAEIPLEVAKDILAGCWDSYMRREIVTAEEIAFYSNPNSSYINFYTADGNKYTYFTGLLGPDEYGYHFSSLIYGKLDDDSFVIYYHNKPSVSTNASAVGHYFDYAIESDETPAELRIADCVLPESEKIKDGQVIAKENNYFYKIFGIKSIDDVTKGVMVYPNGKSVELPLEEAKDILSRCWDSSLSLEVETIENSEYMHSIYLGSNVGYINFYTTDNNKYTLYNRNVGTNEKPDYYICPLTYGKLEDGNLVIYGIDFQYDSAVFVKRLHSYYADLAVESEETPAEVKILDCVLR